MSRSKFLEDHPEEASASSWFGFERPSLDWAFGVFRFGRVGVPGSLIVIPYFIVMVVLFGIGSALFQVYPGPGGLFILGGCGMLGLALLGALVWGVYGLVIFYTHGIRRASAPYRD